ncbi:glutamate--cysteine ligase regulatory subunit-like [Liolophura sinensis]|uniref:glutamate--cysteine ligase regulatory subunit-like n=1 Tax=Liolophura sinensis TaxID=3198878 RepID=UPI003158DF41
MAEEIPLFPKAESMLINSGNIVNWNRLKRNPKQTPDEELAECINETLENFLTSADKTELQYVTDLVCVHSKFKETIPSAERDELKLTGMMFLEFTVGMATKMKVSLCNLQSPSHITEAIDKTMSQLDVTFIETVLLSFPGREEELTLEEIQPYWQVLEGLVEGESASVLSIGVSDLSTNQLKQLYQWAQVKPIINQVNLASCCVMPPDMVEFAKLNDIQLLTHSDPPDVLPQSSFRDLIAANSTSRDAEKWKALWSVRYSVLVKCRGIVKTKGYIVKAVRDMKRQN